MVVLPLALAVVACVPGYQVTEGNEPKQISGRFGGEFRDTGLASECSWLVSADGKRTYLLFMGDLELRADPIRLEDGSGRRLATIGDVVTARGPSSAIGENGCAPQSDIFVVETLVGPGGTWHDATFAEPQLT